MIRVGIRRFLSKDAMNPPFKVFERDGTSCVLKHEGDALAGVERPDEQMPGLCDRDVLTQADAER